MFSQKKKKETFAALTVRKMTELELSVFFRATVYKNQLDIGYTFPTLF